MSFKKWIVDLVVDVFERNAEADVINLSKICIPIEPEGDQIANLNHLKKADSLSNHILCICSDGTHMITIAFPEEVVQNLDSAARNCCKKQWNSGIHSIKLMKYKLQYIFASTNVLNKYRGDIVLVIHKCSLQLGHHIGLPASSLKLYSQETKMEKLLLNLWENKFQTSSQDSEQNNADSPDESLRLNVDTDEAEEDNSIGQKSDEDADFKLTYTVNKNSKFENSVLKAVNSLVTFDLSSIPSESETFQKPKSLDQKATENSQQDISPIQDELSKSISDEEVEQKSTGGTVEVEKVDLTSTVDRNSDLEDETVESVNSLHLSDSNCSSIPSASEALGNLTSLNQESSQNSRHDDVHVLDEKEVVIVSSGENEVLDSSDLSIGKNSNSENGATETASVLLLPDSSNQKSTQNLKQVDDHIVEEKEVQIVSSEENEIMECEPTYTANKNSTIDNEKKSDVMSRSQTKTVHRKCLPLPDSFHSSISISDINIIPIELETLERLTDWGEKISNSGHEVQQSGSMLASEVNSVIRTQEDEIESDKNREKPAQTENTEKSETVQDTSDQLDGASAKKKAKYISQEEKQNSVEVDKDHKFILSNENQIPGINDGSQVISSESLLLPDNRRYTIKEEIEAEQIHEHNVAQKSETVQGTSNQLDDASVTENAKRAHEEEKQNSVEVDKDHKYILSNENQIPGINNGSQVITSESLLLTYNHRYTIKEEIEAEQNHEHEVAQYFKTVQGTSYQLDDVSVTKKTKCAHEEEKQNSVEVDKDQEIILSNENQIPGMNDDSHVISSESLLQPDNHRYTIKEEIEAEQNHEHNLAQKSETVQGTFNQLDDASVTKKTKCAHEEEKQNSVEVDKYHEISLSDENQIPGMNDGSQVISSESLHLSDNRRYTIKEQIEAEQNRLRELAQRAINFGANLKPSHLFPVVKLERCTLTPEKINSKDESYNTDDYIEESPDIIKSPDKHLDPDLKLTQMKPVIMLEKFTDILPSSPFASSGSSTHCSSTQKLSSSNSVVESESSTGSTIKVLYENCSPKLKKRKVVAKKKKQRKSVSSNDLSESATKISPSLLSNTLNHRQIKILNLPRSLKRRHTSKEYDSSVNLSNTSVDVKNNRIYLSENNSSMCSPLKLSSSSSQNNSNQNNTVLSQSPHKLSQSFGSSSMYITSYQRPKFQKKDHILLDSFDERHEREYVQSSNTLTLSLNSSNKIGENVADRNKSPKTKPRKNVLSKKKKCGDKLLQDLTESVSSDSSHVYLNQEQHLEIWRSFKHVLQLIKSSNNNN